MRLYTLSQTINYNWQYSSIFEPVFHWENRYIALTGGRASGKSWFLAHYFLETLLYKKSDLLCAREHQNSISESNYKLFVNVIKKYNLPYDIQSTKIISKTTGATIVFIGLSDITADNVKSFEDFKLVWLEEAQKISAKSWENLNPTIRTDKAQIYLSMNPDCKHEKHPIMSELLTIFKDETLHIHANYYDNPFVSKDIIKMAELTKQYKPDEYERVWLGIPDDNDNNTVVKYFTTDNIMPLTYQPDLDLHLTWDFNVDPMSCIIAHKTKDKVFYIDEFILENATTKSTIEAVLKKYNEHKGNFIVNGDASGDNRSTQSEWSNYVIMKNVFKNYYPNKELRVAIRPSNPRIKNRIAAFNNMVLDYNGKCHLFVDPKCEKLLYNIYNLKYKVGSEDVDVPTYHQIKNDTKLKFLEHPFDAASYLVEYYFPIKSEV